MRVILVTGSGTESGKTITSAALTACAQAAGLRVAVVKPVQTGVGEGQLGDVGQVQQLTDLNDVHELARFAEALAPGTAARRLGLSGPSAIDLRDRVLELADRDMVIVEGAGGALVHLNATGETVLDLALGLREGLADGDSLSIVLTASCALGTLHSTAATALAVRGRGLGVDHLVVTDWPAGRPDLAQVCNLDDLPRYSGAPISGVLPMGMGQLSRERFAEQSVAGLAPALGGVFDTADFSRLAARP